MDQVHRLAAAFLAHTKVRFVPPVDAAALGETLVQAWENARARWLDVALPDEQFVTHLAQRLPEAGPLSSIEPLLAQFSVAELYLACACLHKIPSAPETFERNYVAKLPAFLRRRNQSEAMVEDICQMTLERILVAAKIGDYLGRGSLLAWVRVTAAHIAAKNVDKHSAQEDGLDDFVQQLLAPGVDPELELSRSIHHAHLRQALREAFAALSSDDRHLVRLYFVDRLTTYKLAPLYQVDQSTISRRLANALKAVREQTKRLLQARLGQSFERLLDSQFQVSISQLLE